MSLLPFVLGDDFIRPSRLSNQHFGLVLDPEDLLSPLTLSVPERPLLRLPPHYGHLGYIRPWKSAASDQDSGSTVAVDKDKFQANLDVQQFKPEEITVKVTGDNMVTIEGKHEEKQDEHGYISRHFLRRYVLPKDCDVNKIESKLSSDGILSIVAPRVDNKEIKHTEIPITQTGKPLKTDAKPAVTGSGDKK